MTDVHKYVLMAQDFAQGIVDGHNDDDDPVRIQALKNSSNPDDRSLGEALERRQQYLGGQQQKTTEWLEQRANEYRTQHPDAEGDPVITPPDPGKWTIPQLNERLNQPHTEPAPTIERPTFDAEKGWISGPENPIISDEPGSTPSTTRPAANNWKPDA